MELADVEQLEGSEHYRLCLSPDDNTLTGGRYETVRGADSEWCIGYRALADAVPITVSGSAYPTHPEFDFGFQVSWPDYPPPTVVPPTAECWDALLGVLPPPELGIGVAPREDSRAELWGQYGTITPGIYQWNPIGDVPYYGFGGTMTLQPDGSWAIAVSK